MARDESNTGLYLGLAAVGLLAVGGAVALTGRGRRAAGRVARAGRAVVGFVEEEREMVRLRSEMRPRAKARIAARLKDKDLVRLEKAYAVRRDQLAALEAEMRKLMQIDRPSGR